MVHHSSLLLGLSSVAFALHYSICLALPTNSSPNALICSLRGFYACRGSSCFSNQLQTRMIQRTNPMLWFVVCDGSNESHWWLGDSKVLYYELHPPTHVHELLGTHTSVLLFFFRCLFRCFSLPVFFSFSYWFYGILLTIKPSFSYTRNQRSCHNLDSGVCVEEEILGAVLPYIL